MKPWINVKDVGAKGDGKHDDTQAIIDAIWSLEEYGGTIYIPAGRYILSRGVYIEINKVTVVGDGMGATVLQLRDNVEEPVLGLLRTRPNFSNTSIMVRDLTLDGNRKNQPPDMEEQYGYFAGFLAYSPESDYDIACYRLEVKNFAGYGFDPHEHVNRLHLVNCVSHHNLLDGFTIDACHYAFLRGCISYSNDRHGYNLVTATTETTLDSNMAYDNGVTGIMVQHGSNFNKIVNNEVFRNKGHGISLRDAPDNMLQDNSIYGNMHHGLSIRGTKSTTVTDNRIQNNSQEEDGRYNEIFLGSYKELGTSDTMVANNHVILNSPIRARYGIYEQGEKEGITQSNNMFAHNKVRGAARTNYRFDGTETIELANV